MWAQTWEGLYDLLAPYPAAGTVDVTAEMVAQVNDKMEKCSSISLIIVHLFFSPNQKWDAMRMFKTAEEFYTSLDLQAMPTCYGSKSMIEKPTDGREVVCHASAWDFSDGEDFR